MIDFNYQVTLTRDEIVDIEVNLGMRKLTLDKDYEKYGLKSDYDEGQKVLRALAKLKEYKLVPEEK